MPTAQLDLAPASEIAEIQGRRRPLETAKHEAMARLVACKYLSASAAYRSVYGGEESNPNTIKSVASEIMTRPDVKARVEYLKSSATERSAFNAAKKMEYLESVVTTPPSEIDADSPLCQGLKPSKYGDQVLIPDKLAALKLHALLAGELREGGDTSIVVNALLVGMTLPDAPSTE